MIKFSVLGQRGRLGNQLFQIASIYGIAKRFNTTCAFPNWKYDRYFKNKLPKNFQKRTYFQEPQFHYSEDWLEDDKDYDGWLQSEKYFESREAAKKLFEFEPVFQSLIRSKYSKYFERETICVSIRRGDFVGNKNYELIPIKFYIGALMKFDFRQMNILFFSDDISYCKTHFECLENAYFIDDDPIEQLCLMTMCSNHIISQSTFSWWGAYLSDSKRVIRPAYNFTEEYRRENDDKDFWPDGWEVFDHKKYWINLDATICIPVKYDHDDRKENLKLVLSYLRNDFHCKILVGEIGDNFGLRGEFERVEFIYKKFHRTKILNELAKLSSDVFINYDADVIMPPMALIEAVYRIKQGADMVYPYDGRFARVQRKWYSELLRYLDCGILSKYSFDGTRAHDMRSVGGCVVFNKESFFSGGGENENFISYGSEDVERFERFTRLGFRVERVQGVLYHIDHFIGLDSYIHHQYYHENENELHRIRNLTDEELQNEFNNTLQK